MNKKVLPMKLKLKVVLDEFIQTEQNGITEGKSGK